MEQPQQPELRNRYPGVKPFTSAEKELFFGRENDIDALYSLIFVNQSVVLYGKSGYGKSSLINAGILPRLLGEGKWLSFPVRFNNFSERASASIAPMENVRLRLQRDLNPEATGILDKLIPGEGSLWYWIKAHQASEDGPQSFVLFFDQAEELFTYPKSQVDEFSEQLSQLLYNTVPLRFRKRLSEIDEMGEIHEKGLLTENEHQYLYNKPDIRVVFSIRTDRLSLLNALADRHPTVLRNLYELDALGPEQADMAIRQPAQAPQSEGFLTPPWSYSDTAVEKILNSVSNPRDGKIEAATLQIVCRYVEDELVRAGGQTLITGDQLGDISDIFQQYYESVLNKLSPEEHEKAQRLIEDELIENGKRNPLTEGYIKRKFGFSDALLLQLEQSSLLRKERDATDRLFYEISHDTLVNPIEKVAMQRREAEAATQQKKWEATRALEKQALEETLKKERERAAKLEELNRKAVNRSRLALLFALLSFIGIALVGYFYKESKKEKDKAEMEEKHAEIALFENNYQKASDLVVNAEQVYMVSKDYNLALKNLLDARDLLNTKTSLPEKDRTGRDKLLADITLDMQLCETSKK